MATLNPAQLAAMAKLLEEAQRKQAEIEQREETRLKNRYIPDDDGSNGQKQFITTIPPTAYEKTRAINIKEFNVCKESPDGKIPAKIWLITFPMKKKIAQKGKNENEEVRSLNAIENIVTDPIPKVEKKVTVKRPRSPVSKPKEKSSTKGKPTTKTNLKDAPKLPPKKRVIQTVDNLIDLFN